MQFYYKNQRNIISRHNPGTSNRNYIKFHKIYTISKNKKFKKNTELPYFLLAKILRTKFLKNQVSGPKNIIITIFLKLVLSNKEIRYYTPKNKKKIMMFFVYFDGKKQCNTRTHARTHAHTHTHTHTHFLKTNFLSSWGLKTCLYYAKNQKFTYHNPSGLPLFFQTQNP